MKKIFGCLLLVFAGARAFAVDPEPYTLGVSFSFRQQGVGNAIMTVYDVTSPSVDAMSPSGAVLESGMGLASLKPGRAYDVLFQSSGITDYWLSFTAPNGYQVYIDGVPQDLLHGVPTFQPFWHYYSVELRPVAGDGRLDAGAFTGIDLGKAVGWEVGLGGLRSGRSAGRIGFREQDLSQLPAANRDRLFYTPPSGTDQINVVKNGSSNQTLGQILTPQTFVNIADLTASPNAGYEIRFYHPSQASWTGANYAITGSPWKTIKVESPATNQLKITETEGSVSQVSLLSLTTGTVPSGTYAWQLQEGSPTTWLRTRIQDSVLVTGAREVTDSTYTGTNTAVSPVAKTKYRYENVGGWGEELKKVLAYPLAGTNDADAVTTEFDYYVDSNARGNYRRIKSTTSSGDIWSALQYYDDWDRRGRVYREFKPYMDLPASASFSASAGVVTTYDYAPDWSGRYNRVSSRTEQVNGQDSGRTTTSWGTSDLARDRADSDLYRTASAYNRTHTETMSALNAEEAGQLWMTKDPDGPQTSVSRARGDCVNWTFTLNPSGNYWREVRVSGTWNSSAGTAASSWDGQYFEPIYLVQNRSTMEVMWRDPAGNLIKRETYVFAGYGWSSVTSEWLSYSNQGRLTQHSDYNGAINTTHVWVNGRLESTTDAAGIRNEFVYDELGRVTRSAKIGTTATLNSAIAGSSAVYDVQGTLYAHNVYDGAGRVIESVTTPSAVKPAAPGSANDLFSSASFDLAGRLVSSTAPGGYVTTTAYDHANRKTTVTLPGAGTPQLVT